MKKIIPALLAIVLVSCTKNNQPEAFDPNRTYYMRYQTDDQIVKTRVDNDILRLDFYENVNLLVDVKDYSSSTWALCILEDFTNSYLKPPLEFNALASAAGYAHNWVPANLNDAAPGQKTTSKVTFEGKEYIKVTIQRVFEFYSPLGSNQAAINQQNALLATTNHTVKYKTFYMYGGGYSQSNDATIKLVYTK